MHRISLIAALGERTRAIGRDNKLLWQLSGDLPRFKRLTNGHPVIAGHHTWLSLPEHGRPLPGRTNIVIATSTSLVLPPGVLRAFSFEEALELAEEVRGSDEIFVIGGGRVYAEAIPCADRLYLTLVDDDADGDTFFPGFGEFRKVIEEETHPEHSPAFRYVTLER
ncbi:MAG TPA: dihydrofolate reductase [Candidatus Paceibacterota bacterium]|jgi:dihydrofolate reductase